MSHPVRVSRLAAVLAVALACFLVGSEAFAGHVISDGSSGSNDRILPPNSMPYGKSYGDWGAAFWSWDYAQPFATNPIFDPTGAFNMQNQSGPVWFLAGNSGGASVRNVTIPAGRAKIGRAHV